jgi:5-methylcytosine-specific restriction endonuclease McrA
MRAMLSDGRVQCTGCGRYLERSSGHFQWQVTGVRLHSRCRECRKEKQREAWRARTIEGRRADRRARYVRNQAAERTRSRRYRVNGRAGAVAEEGAYDAEPEVTDAEFRARWVETGGVCLACGSVDDLELDHVIPLALGGRHVMSNVQPLCRGCNARKGVRIIDFRVGPGEWPGEIEELPFNGTGEEVSGDVDEGC